MTHSSPPQVAFEDALAGAVDADFYIFAYGDVVSGTTAAAHYASIGWREGRDPNPWFSTRDYLAENPDLAGADVVPLFHFLEHGFSEGRPVRPSQLAQAYHTRKLSAIPAAPAYDAGYKPPADWRDNDIVRALFEPALYCEPGGSNTSEFQTSWDRFLSNRLPARAFPSLLFDPDFYEKQAREGGLPPFRAGESPLEHWLREGLPRRIVPTPRFDEDYYRRAYADIAAADQFGFIHFLRYGLAERRKPTFWFDPPWYRERYRNTFASSEQPAYFHFLLTGIDCGNMPGPALADYAQQRDRHEKLTVELYEQLVAAANPWLKAVVHDYALRFLVTLYVAEWQPDGHDGALTGLLGYLLAGPATRQSPGPLFDERIYRERLNRAGFAPLDRDESPLVHWLTKGISARIVPTQRFDAAFYQSTYSDMDDRAYWVFEHFLFFGAAEERRPDKTPRISRLRFTTRSAPGSLPSCYRRWIAEDRGAYAANGLQLQPERPIIQAENRLEALMESDGFRKIVARVQAIEPAVGYAYEKGDVYFPPLNDWLGFAHAELRRRLNRDRYDTIICVPWVRMGGADLVAGHLAKALYRLRPDERVVVVLTREPDFERPEWFPASADVVDISDLQDKRDASSAEILLYMMISGLSPKRVFNINSELCWKTMRRFGSRLAESTNLYGYLFCWDELPNGARVGFPSVFFPETFDSMTAFLTDTVFLKEQLADIYRLPEPAKVVTTFMPAQTKLLRPSVADRAARTFGRRREKFVIWAGRLDRQKRFDLVQSIARLMPDVQFHCWGKPVLDSPPDLSLSPGNVVMHDPFRSFDELPLNEADAWLFTSDWEGMPNTLIEVATHGFPVVASAVGGVPELVRPDTGWPVARGSSPQAYADALTNVFANPDEAVARAERLQRLVAQNYNEPAYDRAIASVIENE